MNSYKASAFAAITLALSSFPPLICAENSCSSVDRTLTKERGAALAPAVATHLHAKHAEISQSFRYGGWSILYVSTGEADDAYVFYSADPLQGKFVTLRSGIALEGEEQEIRDWTFKNAPGIPRVLARCFAWHVTKER
jgi:hypothetical protein